MIRNNMKPDRIQIRPDDGPRWLGIDVRASVVFASFAEAAAFVFCATQLALEQSLDPDVDVRHRGDAVVVTVELTVAPDADLGDVHRQLDDLMEQAASVAGFEVT